MPFVTKSLDDVYSSLAADARRRLPELSDFQDGSVLRSLLESFSAEVALLYQQLDLVYQSGFIDTAQDANLDRVVALLGIKRNEPDYATGVVTFTRDPGSNVDLTIPIATLVSTEEKEDQNPPKKSYLTTQTGVMAAGKDAVDVPVQASEQGRQMTTDAATVVVMPRPVPGVKTVGNSDPIRFLGRDRESDDELRQRAKQALLASGRASVISIENALLGMPGVRDVHVKEDFPADGTLPANAHFGEIEVYVDGLSAKNAAAIRERLDQVRAAGVYAQLKPAVAVNLDAVLMIDADPKVPSAERSKLEESARDALINLVDGLRMGEPLLFSQMSAAILKVTGVNDIVEFAMSTFIEADTFATGKVTLHREPPPVPVALTVPQGTTVRTGLGLKYRLTADATFKDQDVDVTVDVVALAAGRAGELLRTGSATNWDVLAVGGTKVSFDNADPIALPRKAYQLSDRTIPIQDLQRLTPNSIRVASQVKDLKVRVQIKLQDAADREKKRKPLEDAVQAFFQALAAKPDRSFTKPQLAAVLGAVAPAPNPLDLRLVAFPFQSPVPQDDFQVECSFIEKPVPEIVFVYTAAVQLTGSLNLILSLTAGPEDKRIAAGTARQAIMDYLDSAGPEQDIGLDQIQQIAAGIEKVLRVEFKPENCTLLDARGALLPDRVQGTRAKVKAFEKVFLSDDKFVIQA